MASDLPPDDPLPPLSRPMWESLPEGPVSVTLTKRDIRELYFALLDICDSQTYLQQALIHYSNANLGFAQQNLNQSQKMSAHGLERVNNVMSSIMMKARSGP
jgi:hypothetical protein